MIRRLEYWWRHYIVYPVLRLVFRNPKQNSSIDIHSVKRLLVLRYDRIGDMIVTTPFFKILKAANPNMRIGVLASKINAEIIQHNPNVDVIHVLTNHWWQIAKEIKNARKENYDVVVNLVFNRTTSGGILANLIAPNGIKIGQGDEKYRFLFNRLQSVVRDDKQMVDIIASYLRDAVGLNISSSNQHYELNVDDETRKYVASFLEDNKLIIRKTKMLDHLPYVEIGRAHV
jgi:ADP-heptose:LPS heptosyltransferase